MKSSIVRVVKKGNFTRISNQALRNGQLSWAARGALAYILSKPDNWQVRTSDLVQQGPSGPGAVQAILKELESRGYLRRERGRQADGKYDWGTTVYEDPELAADNGSYQDEEYPDSDVPF
jgi:DNA-binding MarR family transcriptional regulator